MMLIKLIFKPCSFWNFEVTKLVCLKNIFVYKSLSKSHCHFQLLSFKHWVAEEYHYVVLCFKYPPSHIISLTLIMINIFCLLSG